MTAIHLLHPRKNRKNRKYRRINEVMTTEQNTIDDEEEEALIDYLELDQILEPIYWDITSEKWTIKDM